MKKVIKVRSRVSSKNVAELFAEDIAKSSKNRDSAIFGFKKGSDIKKTVSVLRKLGYHDMNEELANAGNIDRNYDYWANKVPDLIATDHNYDYCATKIPDPIPAVGILINTDKEKKNFIVGYITDGQNHRFVPNYVVKD